MRHDKTSWSQEKGVLQKDFAGGFLNEAMGTLDLEGYKLGTYQADTD